MKAKHQRLLYVVVSLVILGLAAALVMRAMRSQIVYFYTPSELSQLTPQQKERTMRLGGLVEAGSHVQKASIHEFRITDGQQQATVRYNGSMPALFREGQGVVAEGNWDTGAQVLVATQVLAKHDENYMPPEIAKKLKSQGHWKPETQPKQDAR